jgi:hypothetical protein
MTNIVTVTEIVRCRWCGRRVEVAAGRGRPRGYCRRSCRQRAYEARRRAAELGVGETEVIMTKAELQDLQDRIYVLQCAVEDVERDLASDDRPAAVQEALAWLLANARPLTSPPRSA